MNKRIYLDYNATTPLSEEVRQFYIAELGSYANGSSLHEDGRVAAKKITVAREQVSTLVNVKPEEIIFTSGGSESNNMVFNTMIEFSKKRGRNLIITTAIEHPCVLESSKRLASSFDMDVRYLPVDGDGMIKMDAYRAALAEKPLLVSIMTANNEIGTVQDIKTLAAIAHKAGALFHTDAVQAAGKIPVDLFAWNVDYATFSAHKIYAPKGVGALCVKNGCPIEPFIRGGHQEHGLRAGTYNAPAIAAYGYAAELARKELPVYEAHTRTLRNRLRDGLLEFVPGVRINGHSVNVLPNTLDVSFPGAEGEAILLHLDLLGVSVSTGSACASGSLEPSHVLMATGLGPELAHGSIRFSFGKYNIESDVDFLLEHIPPVIARLRKMSSVSFCGMTDIGNLA
ncbi:cysteine desulfurase family protein [Treponema endosymbiont of Eucomonympha sp.]|uniref:cysteine desulfurase family protein n=1 Tax=Treponema endosymbiont of Eucomonympha sp. TaxID=1580831 RepID=UPI0007508A64|nr:cysteine desulfurase family protein [Treponema endosymbiont of Eucomonympha sp.]